MKKIRIGEVSIPLDSYVVGGTALLGIRESGKTYTAKGIAEQLLDFGVPIVVFDAIGVWRYLKVAGPGKDGKAFKVVVAGGKEPDLPLTPASAPEIVRAAIRENIPLIIDLYDKRLSKSDWRKIVQACFRTLLYENTGLRHIFLEETAEYAPQKVIDGETYAEVEKMARMGGNASLGITLINQRAQEVNKAVLDLCENVILMRQRGAHAIDNLEKWMDHLSPDLSKQIAKAMPNMKQGDGWVFTGDSVTPVLTRSAPIRSYHPDRRKPEARAATKVVADTGDFVTKLTSELTELTKQAAANDPAKLKARITELDREISKLKNAPTGAPSVEQLQAAERRGYLTGMKQVGDVHRATVLRAMTEFQQVSHRYIDFLRADIPEMPAPTVTVHAPRPIEPATERALGEVARRAAKVLGQMPSNGTLTKAERLVMTSLAQYPEGRSKTQIAILTGYASTGGGFNNALSSLRTKGYVEGSGDRLSATDAGLDALGSFEPLPHGAALLAHWMGQLSKAERGCLQAIVEAYPGTISKPEVAAATSYEPNGGGFNNALSRLRTLELIEGRGDSLRASEALFG